MQELVIKDPAEEVVCECGSVSDFGCHGIRDGEVYSEFYCRECYNKKKG
jgi:hypothetical protein